MQVRPADLVAQYNGIEAEIDDAIAGVLRSGSYVLGQRVKDFEEGLARYCGVKYAIGVNSGTDAILLSLMALGVGPGDEVIMPAFTIMVDAAVVCLLKAKPVFVDIDPRTFNVAPEQLEDKITDRTKAVIAVHLFGQPSDMDRILAITQKRGVAVLEDACQAIGAGYKDRKVGSLADLGCFSFYPTKNLGGYGDGGAITTNDGVLAERVRLLRAHGDAGQYDHVVVGINSRLDEIQAAVLSVKLKRVDLWNQARHRNGRRYTLAFRDIENLVTPYEDVNCRHVYHQYTIRTSQRDELRRYLRRREVTAAVYYPIPLHLQKALSHLGHATGEFPASERAAREVLSIPVYAELEPEKIEYVSECIAEFFSA